MKEPFFLPMMRKDRQVWEKDEFWLLKCKLYNVTWIFFDIFHNGLFLWWLDLWLLSSFEFFFAAFGFQEHRLEKEKHLEDYLRDHPPPPSSTTTKGPITTLSTNTSKPGSEGDKGSGEGTSNTDAKENTEPSTEPAKQSTPTEEPEADKTLKSVPLIQSKSMWYCRYTCNFDNLL